MSREKILDVIDRLPIDYLLLFSEYIMEILSTNDSDIQESWKDEVQRRMDGVHQGSCAFIPSEDLHNKLYRLFKENETEPVKQQSSNEGPTTLKEIIEEIATYSEPSGLK